MIIQLKKIVKDQNFLMVLILIIGLFVFKYEDLFLPFFSDELWAYGPAIRKMSVFGPSLLPSSLSLSDHWAHPLLFFFLVSSWAKMFGASLFTTHLFASILSSFLIIALYIIVKELINKRVAFFSVLIFSSQSIFLGQYNLLLPEVLLTLLTFLTFYCSEKRYNKLYLLFGIGLVLTKESGVFPLLAIILWNFLKDVFYDKTFKIDKINIVKYTVLVLPFFALLTHFALLKNEYGWLIMPLRTDSIQFEWDVYHERLMSTIHYLYIDQGRKIITILLFFGGILFYPNVKLSYRIGLIALSFCLMKVFFGYWSLPSFFEYLIVPILFFVVLKIIFIDVYKSDEKAGGLISFTIILSLIYILFISSFFDSRRYLLFLIPLFIIVFLYFIDKIPFYKKIILPIISIMIISSSIYYQMNDSNQGDDTNHYSNLCIIQKQMVGFIEDKYDFNIPIYTSFLIKHSLERPLTGHLSTLKSFNNVKSTSNSNEYKNEGLYIFSNTELPENYDIFKKRNDMILVKKYQKRNSIIEIYKN